jgi:phosphoribosylaminoimidazole-succinocarboxamide synthase
MLKKLYSGKTAEVYEVNEQCILVRRTGRISAQDKVIKGVEIPKKGEINNALTIFFKKEICNESAIPVDLIEGDQHELSIFVEGSRKTDCFGCLSLNRKVINSGIEFIARRYNVGSFKKAFEKGEAWTQCFGLPADLEEYGEFDRIIFTPSIKNEVGEDVNVTKEEMRLHLSKVFAKYNFSEKQIDSLAKDFEEYTMTGFSIVSKILESSGLRLVDIKFEFGIFFIDGEPIVCLIDEISPDTMRAWLISSIVKGGKPKGVDKDIAREEYRETGGISEDGIQKTADAYNLFATLVLPEDYFSAFAIH